MFGRESPKGVRHRIALDPTQLQVGKFRPAKDKMQMAFDKTRQQGGPLAVDHFGRRPCQRLNRRARAKGKDARTCQRNGFGARICRVHRQNPGVGQDHCRGHSGPCGGFDQIFLSQVDRKTDVRQAPQSKGPAPRRPMFA